jgi:hypothetical protein
MSAELTYVMLKARLNTRVQEGYFGCGRLSLKWRVPHTPTPTLRLPLDHSLLKAQQALRGRVKESDAVRTITLLVVLSELTRGG